MANQQMANRDIFMLGDAPAAYEHSSDGLQVKRLESWQVINLQTFKPSNLPTVLH
jgi:hypothetical protein